MTLKALFALPIAAILFVTLVLAGTIVGRDLSHWRQRDAAVQAARRMRLLIEVQTELSAERVVTNGLLGQTAPRTPRLAWRLAAARNRTNERIDALIAAARDPRTQGQAGVPRYLVELVTHLGTGRAAADALLARERGERTLSALDMAMERMLQAGRTLDRPSIAASGDVTAADPDLSGLLVMARLAETYKSGIARIAGILTPRQVKAELVTGDDLRHLETYLVQMAQLLTTLENAAGITGPSPEIPRTLEDLRGIETSGLGAALQEAAARGADDETGRLPTQQVLLPWVAKADALRFAIIDAAIAHVEADREAARRRLTVVAAAVAAVGLAIIASLALLHRRVVGPLARLGQAAKRIAAGERALVLTARTGTREVDAMVQAVETLRQAAVIADAAATRQKETARQRLAVLRQALDIVETVREPAQAMVLGVTRLASGIEAASALSSQASLSLSRAAEAVHAGLVALRQADAEFDGVMAAQGDGADSEAAAMARVHAVQAQVDRREAAVRAFVQPGLVALRDAAAGSDLPALRDLVADQFECIEDTVAMLSLMRAAAARAASIVRALSLDETPIAA